MSAINRDNARDVLSHLIAVLSAPPRGYKRYAGLYDVEGYDPLPRRLGRDSVEVRDLLFSSMRDEVFEIFSAPGLKPRQETIRSKAGDISKAQRGVYLHMIEGEDNTWRFFVGQADNMSFRIRRQHQNFRHRRDNPSFHTFAMEKSRWDYFIILAVLPPGPTFARFTPKEEGLLLNILQMWCAMLFCTLQPSTMAQWHEYGGIRRPWCGLNLACPLDYYGGPAKFVDWRHVLKESEDPLANAYVTEVLDGKLATTQGRGWVFGVMVGVVLVVWIASLPPGRGGRGRGKAW